MTGLGFDVSLVVEVVLTVLLAATVAYCALLERRLRGLRQDQAVLAQTVEALNSGIGRAHGALAALKNAAAEAGAALDANMGNARMLADELSVIVAAGERIATRIESGRAAAPVAAAPATPVAPRAPTRIIRPAPAQGAEARRAVR